jgi:hypothetical protein
VSDLRREIIGAKIREGNANMNNVLSDKEVQNRRFAIGRPRWENLALVVSLAAFWGGVFLKFIR